MVSILFPLKKKNSNHFNVLILIFWFFFCCCCCTALYGISKPVSKRHLLPVTQVMSCRCLCRPTCAHSSREPATPRPRLPFRSIFASFLPSAQAFLVLTQLKLLFFFFFVVGFQLWDVRDGMCRQTFSGHESDINAIGVSTLIFHGLKLTRLKTD